MPNWVAKAVLQKAISYLPYSNKINYLFQRYLTKGIVLTEELFRHKLEHAAHHVGHYGKYSVGKNYGKALELGTGWYPVVPICLYLNGFSRIVTIDQSSLLRIENVREVMQLFIRFYNDGTLHFPVRDGGRIALLKEVAEDSSVTDPHALLKKLNIEVIVGDAGRSGLKDNSVDFFVSNNTLEHIPEPVIIHIFNEFRRIAGKGSIMSHFIDLTDHFAHFDKSISKLNFLRFSPAQWKWINNDVQYLNRLRIDTYYKIHKQTGWEIIEKEHIYADKTELSRIPLDKEFAHLPEKDLLISHTWLVSK